MLDTASKDPGQPLEPLEPLAESSYTKVWGCDVVSMSFDLDVVQVE